MCATMGVMANEVAAIEERLRVLQTDSEHVRERTDLLNSLGWDLRHGDDWNRVLELAQEAKELADSCGYQRGVAGSLRNAAFAHYMLSNFEAAIAESLESLRLFQEVADSQGEAHARAVIGFVQWTLGNYDQALTEGFQSLHAAEENDDKWGIGWCCTLIGGIYQNLRDHDQAVRYYKRSHELFAELDIPIGEARSLIGIGAAYQAMGQSDQALECVRRSLEISQRTGNRMGESRALSDLGIIYQEQGREDEALELHLRSLRIREEDNSRQAATTSLLNLGRLYLKRGDSEQALKQARKALAIAEEIGAKPKAYQSHQLLSQIYEENGDLARALRHERIFRRIHEEVFNEEASIRVRNLQISLETERSQKEAEIHRLRNVELKAKNEELARLLAQLQATQAQLVQSEKLAALGNLVAAIAHEINSPLGVIQNSFDLAQRCTERILAAVETASSLLELKTNDAFIKTAVVLRENLEVTVSAVERVTKIVRSLKSFARLDQAEYTPMDVNRALEDVLSLARPLLKKEISIVRSYGEVPRLCGYAAELNQVFMNLLQNGAQAIEGAGTITLSTFADDRSVFIKVADTGRGIPAEQLPRLFDPGFIAKGDRVKAAMSLFSCYHIIRKHDGTIHVESEPGRGTTFTVQLPRALERRFVTPPTENEGPAEVKSP
jgi:signal transduction histidine kinase